MPHCNDIFNLVLKILHDPPCYGDNVTVTCQVTPSAINLVEWVYGATDVEVYDISKNVPPFIVGGLTIINVTIDDNSVATFIATIQELIQNVTISCAGSTMPPLHLNIHVQGNQMYVITTIILHAWSPEYLCSNL